MNVATNFPQIRLGLQKCTDGKRIRRAILNRLHYVFNDRWFEPGEVHKTATKVPLEKLDYDESLRQHSVSYDPTPRFCVNWAINALEIDPSNYCFVDIGSGRGRVVMTAADYPFQNIIGYELDPHLVEQTRENVSALAGIDARLQRIDVHCENAAAAALPEGPTVFYLFNPFDAVVTQTFLEHLCQRPQSASMHDRLIFVNLAYPELLERFGFKRIATGVTTNLSMKLISPYDIQMFKRRPGMEDHGAKR